MERAPTKPYFVYMKSFLIFCLYEELSYICVNYLFDLELLLKFQFSVYL